MIDMKKVIGVGLLLIGAVACNTVRPYEKQYLNDSEMELSSKNTERFEASFQIYREGAVGASGGKSGGGCGCN